MPVDNHEPVSLWLNAPVCTAAGDPLTSAEHPGVVLDLRDHLRGVAEKADRHQSVHAEILIAAQVVVAGSYRRRDADDQLPELGWTVDTLARFSELVQTGFRLLE